MRPFLSLLWRKDYPKALGHVHYIFPRPRERGGAAFFASRGRIG
jgi:hypothetical protein